MNYEEMGKLADRHPSLFTDADDCTAEYIYRKEKGDNCEIVSSRSASKTFGKHTLNYVQVTDFRYHDTETRRTFRCYVMGAYL